MSAVSAAALLASAAVLRWRLMPDGAEVWLAGTLCGCPGIEAASVEEVWAAVL